MKEWKWGADTEAEILHRIAAAAANYTPEWNFSMEDPDIGSALAYIYADMTEDTVRQLEKVRDKNRLAFFNSLGAKQRNASAARGFAVFRLVQGAPGGTEVDAHTGLTAEVPEADGGCVRFVTAEDLYVTPAQPVCMYLTDGQRDGIYRLSGHLKEPEEPIVLFREKGENLQKHELYLAHDEVLHIRGEACVEIGFYARKGQPFSERQMKTLADPENVCFSYWTGDHWQAFSEVLARPGSLLLKKETFLPAFAKLQMGKAESYVIRCQVKDIAKTGEVSAEEVLLGGRGNDLPPQYIYGASVECSLKECFPFGERMHLYEEVYFGSEEVLTKRGALISFSFYLDFAEIPSETAVEDAPFEWKWVMKRSEFRPDPTYDITVEEVIWEYYNGSGWSRLFPDGRYKDIFRTGLEADGRQRTMTFVCPQDMAPILVNSCETCYIRARIVKIKNLYRIKGKYIAPVVGRPVFSYHYAEVRTPPQMLCMENNGDKRIVSGKESRKTGKPLRLFTGLPEKEKCLYLGFRQPPVGSPIRMLWVMEDSLPGLRGSICWEYECSRGYREMHAADLTDHLARSGSVTFVGQEDFCKASHFGQELYWIRLRDESGFYSEHQTKRIYPVLRSLWMNAVEIRHMEREETESFTLAYYEENCSFKLMYGNIDRISVEVSEDGIEEHWVLWEEVSDLEFCQGGSRVFQIDRTEGILRFGNGSHGRVPPFGKPAGIRVHYSCGGGSRGNVAPEKVNKLNRTVGFVSSVSNPMALWGGLDTETPAEAIRRCSARLRHRDRAVTARDYEELAMEASATLKKVRCFGGKNAEGEKEPGAITLVIYLKNRQADKNLYYAVQEEIRKYLVDRMDTGIVKQGRFYITEPKMVEIQVRAEVMVEDFQDIFAVRRRAQERIRSFLDPVNGHFGGMGWEIGELPNAMQLKNVLKEIPQIIWISRIYYMTFVNGPGGRQEVEPEDIRRHPFVLPKWGKVEVMVTVKGR